MNSSLAWRAVLILVIVLAAAYAAYPPDEKLTLGLDLRGGIHLVLAVQTEDAYAAERDKDLDTLLRELREKHGITGADGVAVDNDTFRLTGVGADRQADVQQVVDDLIPVWNFHRDGAGYLFSRRVEEITKIREQSIRQALQTINNRIDEFGVAEPVIQRQGLGSNRIVVQLPGVDDPQRVIDLIKNTAFLEFRLVDFPSPSEVALDRERVLAHYGGTLPDRVQLFEQDTRDDRGVRTGQQFYALESRTVITGRDLKTARQGLGKFGEPVVNFSLTAEGARTFGEVTGNNIGRGLAIVLDGKVMSAPRINARITDSGVIEGSFTQTEAEDLATVLRSGALPAGIVVLEQRAVGPTLGKESIDQGMKAGLAGAGLVVLTMLIVYRGSGVNAVIALIFNMVIVFGALSYFGATLTLPGIAGLILTVGMAVDANVLVFERIREELHAGRTVKSAIASGFGKALSSIVDANLTTLIAAMFLFQFGTGPIRGFAVTLSVGILASVFTAVVNSRFIFDLLLARRTRVESLSI